MATTNTMVALQAIDFVGSSSNGWTFKIVNNQSVWQADPTTNQSGEAVFEMPSSYGGGGLTFAIKAAGDTATTNAYVVSVAVERQQSGGGSGLATDNFGTASSSTGAAVTTNGTVGIETTTTLSVSHANCGSPAIGDHMRIRIFRVANDGGDTMTGLLNLVSVHVTET